MTQVAFHFNVPDKLEYACRFVRKALRHDAKVAVVAPMAQLRQLSQHMWKLPGPDFLAHAVQGDDAQLMALAPVVLVSEAQSSPHHEVLLHLGESLPEGYAAFDKVVEVVSAYDDHDRSLARERWRSYQQAGYAIERHDLVIHGN